MPIQLPYWASVLFRLHRVKNNARTLFLIENTCMWLIQGICTSPKWHQSRGPFVGLSRVDSFWTEQTLSQWKLQWIEYLRERENPICVWFFFSFFFKESVLLGMKKDFGHFRMDRCECVVFFFLNEQCYVSSTWMYRVGEAPLAQWGLGTCFCMPGIKVQTGTW